MVREYHKWFSTSLEREMQLLVFGKSGTRVLFFPTRKARFYDYENWGVIGALEEKIHAGILQIYTVDSVDAESFYASQLSPGERIIHHLRYEKYILDEVIPFSSQKNKESALLAAGCSLGAYHALNLAFRHPALFNKAVGMSGRYDLTQTTGNFKDLFEGYMDENVYLNMPSRYLRHLNDPFYLDPIKKMAIILAVGETDAFLDNNKIFSQILKDKGIAHELNIWTGEAHHPDQWKQMVRLYF